MRRPLCHVLALLLVVVPMTRPLLAAGDDADATAEAGERAEDRAVAAHGQAALAHATPEGSDHGTVDDAEHGQAALARGTLDVGDEPAAPGAPDGADVVAPDGAARVDLDEILARAQIARRLVELGSTPEEAIAATSSLTAADVEVLARNPDMMQRAGEMGRVGWSIVIGVLIVAGIVAAVIATDGSLSISL